MIKLTDEDRLLKIGTVVDIVDKESIYFGEWGVIKHIDEDGCYHVGIANGDSLAIFDKFQLRICKNQNFV